MRHFLLAATAIIGVTVVAPLANAQAVPPTVVVVPPPNPAAITPSAVDQPGTAVVRLNARIAVDFMAGQGSDDGYRNPATGIAAKTQPYYMGEYARLYPAFDGETPNGVKYGASMEVRQNSGGTGVNNAPANNNGVAGNTLYWRREMGYVGTDKLGTLRFGQTDTVESLFLVGTFENFDFEGGWNGDLPGMFSGGQTPGNGTAISWNFADWSTWYGTSKIVYLSPNFAGFDFGVDWEPSSNQTSGDGACAGTAAVGTITSGCATVSSISGTGTSTLWESDLARRRNMVDVAGRYRGAFGPVGVVMTAAYGASGSVSSDGPIAPPVAYKGLGYFDGGAVLTFGGLAVGGHVDAGSKNSTGLEPKGGKNELDYSAGFSYAAGPFIAGASLIDEIFQGVWDGTATTRNTYGMEHDVGLSVGATYNWAPGSSLYVDYLWGTRHQAGRDFYAEAPGPNNNNTRAQGLVIGQKFQW